MRTPKEITILKQTMIIDKDGKDWLDELIKQEELDRQKAALIDFISQRVKHEDCVEQIMDAIENYKKIKS